MVGNAVRVVVLGLVLLGALGARADFEAGQRAWDAGRPDEALAQWQAAAGSSDRRAMLALGRLYLQGLGVRQDYVKETTTAFPTHAEPTPSRTRTSARTTTDSSQAPQAMPSAAASGAQADSTATPAPASDAGAPPPRAIREAQTLLAARTPP